MRIFYAADTTPNCFFTFKSNLWRNNLYLPLVDLGHEVIEFEADLTETYKHLDTEDPNDRKFIDLNRPKLTRELLKQIKEAHSTKPIDLFFSYFYDACILPEAIEKIKSLGIKTVNWYCNGSYQLHLVSKIAPYYDFCLVPERFRLNDYKKIGANPIYCQEAANPNIYKPFDSPKKFDVTFIGQAYGERPRYIKYLFDKKIDIRVWGFNWKNFSREAYLKPIKRKPFRYAQYLIKEMFQLDKDNFFLPDSIIGDPLVDNEMIKIYSRSKINIGFSGCGDIHKEEEKILQIRLRDFEVPMSGGFYMVEYMEEMEEFFEVGKEIVCYYGMDDLFDKIKYYLKNEKEREKIRQAGYKRCLKEHTWHKRFENAFKEMGLR